MFLIFLSWIYIVFTTINFGYIFDKIIGTKNNNFVVTSILGLFLTTILASIWAIFGRINIEFHLFLLIINCILIIKFKDSIVGIYKSFILEFSHLQKTLKVFLILITSLIFAKCASAPFVIDNESYYIQTIKWINEYGFVKGLANLHIFLGQTSGWHITQSIFNFSFLYKNFNDISGFCLLLGIIFSIQKLNGYYQNNNKNYLITGLFPIFTVFLFQFINAPSPDIPVYVFSFILFFYFLENFKKATPEIFLLIVILTLFLVYIKNTTLALTLLPIILFVIHFKLLSKNILKLFLIISIVFALFIIKNMIICGSPVFPSKVFNTLKTDYAIPVYIENFYYNLIKSYGYFTDVNQYNSMSAFDLFIKWLSLPKLNGIFNKTAVILIALVPLFIYKNHNEKSFWALYLIMVFQLVLFLVTSPQYRFFMNFIMFFLIFCFVCIIRNKKTIEFLLILSLVPTIIILFIPLRVSSFSNHNYMSKTNNFEVENLIFPHKNTKNNSVFVTFQLGNLNYNSPLNNDFFWANGDGDLPCVNKEQIDYFEKYFETIPQMRTTDLKDGFYAKKTKNE